MAIFNMIGGGNLKVETHSSFPAKTELTKLCFVGTTGEYKPVFFAPVKYYEDGTTGMYVWSEGANTSYTIKKLRIEIWYGELHLYTDEGATELRQNYGSDEIVFIGM